MSAPSVADARAILARYYGYDNFRPPQIPAVEAVLSGRDAVIVLPTGGGKSICFQVPALLFPRLTVVVSPLISLMADQVQALERRGIGATFLNSTLSPDETTARVDRLKRGDVKLLYVAPERLTIGPTARLLAEIGVDLLAVDEAHCVSEWGQDFRPSYLRLAATRADLGDPQTVALTATATPRVRRDVARLLALRDPAVIVGGFDRPNLTFRVEGVAHDPGRNQAMIAHLRALRDPGVVYAATRRQVEQVTRILVAGRVNATAYHAGLSAERRERAQADFMNGAAQVIVATNAFGMGIDKPDVRLVLHYLHSGSLEDYYQEAGRAGRDGARSRCVILFNPADRNVHDRMRNHGHVPSALLRRVFERIAADSGGRRNVPLEPRALALRLGEGADADAVALAIRVLQDRGVFPASPPIEALKVRLLASPLRLECEWSALSSHARALLRLAIESPADASEWHCLVVRNLGLAPFALETGIAELESRQLVFVDGPPRTVLVAPTPAARSALARTVHELKKRRDVERAKLDSMVGYATTRTCRRKYILGYFGDRSSGPQGCAHCDVCAPSR